MPDQVRILWWRLRRRPTLLWGALGLLGMALVVRGAWQAQPEPTMAVPVVAAGIAAGTPIDEGSIRWDQRPLSQVPEGVSENPVGRVSRLELVPGELILEGRLGEAHRGPVAGLVPDGHRGVAVGLNGAAPPAMVGDLVDLVATDGASAALTLARSVSVLQADESQITVAVPDELIGEVVTAATLGVLIPVLSGP